MNTPVRFRFALAVRRLLIGAVLLVAVLVPAGMFLPDAGLRWGVVRGLVDLGWAEASVAQAQLSLLKGAVAIRGMQAISAVGEALGIDGVDLIFRWKPLLSRRLSLEQLSLDKADIVLTRQGDGWEVNGLPVPGGGDSAELSLWGYGVTALILTNSTVHVNDGALRVAIAVDRLELRDLESWSPQVPASISLRGSINGAPLTLDGSFHPFADHPDFSTQLSLQGLDAAPFAQWGGLPGWAGKFSAAVHLEGRLDRSAPLLAEGRLDLADGIIPLEGGKVGTKALSWQGRLGWDNGVTAAGTLDVKDLSFNQGQARISTAAAQIHMDGASLDGKFEVLDWSGAMSAKNWVLDMDGLHVQHQQLDWAGVSQLNLSARAKTLFTASGQADSVASEVRSGDWRLSAAKVSAQGEFTHNLPQVQGILPPLTGKMTLKIDHLALRQNDRDWLRADQARFDDLTLSPDALTLGRLDATTVSGLARTDHYGPRFKARSAVVEKIRVSPQGDADVASLALAQPVFRINRDKTGIQGLNDLPSAGAGDSATRRFGLTRLRLTGGQVEFRDRSTTDPVRLSVRDVALALSGLNSARPDQDSPFSLSAAIGDATLAADGAIRPFRPIPGLEITGNIRALELPPLSPYAADALGVNLYTGQLDAKGGLTVKDGTLAGSMDLVLSRLRVAQPDPNAPLAKQADMPIETVLDLLRDGDDRISLSIPVRGDLDNPAFDTSDAVNQAIGGALKSTVFTTLKVAFPLVGLIEMVLDEAEKPVLALQAMTFPAGSAQLDPGQTQSLGKVAALMAEPGRAGLNLNVCGVAVSSSDGPVLRHEASLLARLKAMMAEKDKEELAAFERDRLYRLAEARAQAVKSWLVDQGGIDPGRLFTCRPRIDNTEKAVPRVDLVL